MVKKNEEEMTVVSKTVRFTYRDGCKVARAAGNFALGAPTRMTIGPNTETVIDLGISCDHPVLLVENANRQHSGFIFDAVRPFPPGVPIKLAAKNIGSAPLFLERGDVVAFAVVLDSSDFEIVE